MNDSMHDPWQAKLSEYIDGELAGAERASLELHLEACANCAAALADLRGIVSAARELADAAPASDLWPALERELAPVAAQRSPRSASRSVRWILPFAAGVLATLAVVLLYARRAPQAERVARGESYALLLHEPAGFADGESAAEHAAVVESYARWAADLGARCTLGEELSPDGLELRRGSGAVEAAPATGERVGGFFLLATHDRDEALALARTCPHLERGGWIELRRIQAR